MSQKPYGQFHPALVPKLQTEKELLEAFPTEMDNERYGKVLNTYLICVRKYLEQFPVPQLLQKQLDRPDIDTVCAYELFQMKRHFLETDCLEFKNFHPNKNLD